VGAPSGVVSGPVAANSIPNCAGTNIGDYYTGNVDVSLVSPAFFIPEESGATLSYRQLIDTDAGGDFGSVRVLNADLGDAPIAGLEITNIEGLGVVWNLETLNMPSSLVGGKNIKVEFRFQSDDGDVPDDDVWAGFYIDDVLVELD